MTLRIQLLKTSMKPPAPLAGYSAGFGIYMPEAGAVYPGEKPVKVPLGFATSIPPELVALLLPTLSTGHNKVLGLSNGCGLVDSTCEKEWHASLYCMRDERVTWEKDDQLLQFLLVSISTPEIEYEHAPSRQ